jgi:hypothetical protein
MRCVLAATLVTCLAGQVGPTLAYTCNNILRQFVRASRALAILRRGAPEAYGGVPRW